MKVNAIPYITLKNLYAYDFIYILRIVKILLTHLLSQHPRLWFGVDLHQYSRSADQEHHEVRDTEVHQEDVGGVPHVLGLHDDQGHHDVADHADAEDDDAEDYGGGADVRGEHGVLEVRAIGGVGGSGDRVGGTVDEEIRIRGIAI